MPFLDERDDVRAKVPSGRLPRAVIAGISVVAMLVVLAAVFGVASSARGDFVVRDSASSSPAANDEATQEEGEAAPPAAALGAASMVNGASAAGGVEASSAASCVVYVVGAVKHPGVYELSSPARVNDAVEAAGGLKKDADAAAVNLARAVVDGEQIAIPVKGEASAQPGPASGMAGAEPAESTAGTASSGASAGVVAGSAGIAADGKVNLNTATAAELQSLPGVGEATASKIIASREAEGPFAAPEDLKRVSGIGDKKYAALADLIAV